MIFVEQTMRIRKRVIMGRSRLQTVGSVVVLVAMLGAGCRSESDPPAQRVPATTDASVPSRTAPIQPASSSGICDDPDTLTELMVTRTDEFPRNQIAFVFPDHVTSSDASAVAGVARIACQLPVVPAGEARNCPADFGVTYGLTFTAGTAQVETITADPAGCPSVTGLGPPRGAGPTFWDQLAAALALPAPREYCDPFRGRLPTAPSQCGPLL